MLANRASARLGTTNLTNVLRGASGNAAPRARRVGFVRFVRFVVSLSDFGGAHPLRRYFASSVSVTAAPAASPASRCASTSPRKARVRPGARASAAL